MKRAENKPCGCHVKFPKKGPAGIQYPVSVSDTGSSNEPKPSLYEGGPR